MTGAPAPAVGVDRLDADARREVLELVVYGRAEAVIVDSPPGAGKTELVETTAAVAVDTGRPVLAVAPRNEQTYDLARRFVRDYGLPTTLVHSSRVAPPVDLQSMPGLTLTTRAGGMPRGASLTIANVDKATTMVPDLAADVFGLLVCDESYQVPYAKVMPLLHLAPQRLFVGDPGQLPPLVRGELARYEAARHRVHWAAPRELLRRHDHLPVVRLPATWRFPQDTVDLVQPAFYPALPFVAGAPEDERRIGFQAAGIGGAVDAALDLIQAGASIVAIALPSTARDMSETDEDLADLAAQLAQRLIERGATWQGHGTLGVDQIGYVDAHVASAEQVRRRLRARGVGPELVTTTPEIWQGLQRPVMIAKHTLSGLSLPTGFDLNPGRLCVMLSRHQLAAVVVTRDGVGEALDRHRHDTEERPVGSTDEQFAGWRAHSSLWNTLETQGRIVRA